MTAICRPAEVPPLRATHRIPLSDCPAALVPGALGRAEARATSASSSGFNVDGNLSIDPACRCQLRSIQPLTFPSFAFWSHKCAIFLALSEAAPSKRRRHKIGIVSYLQNHVAEWLVVILQALDTNSTSYSNNRPWAANRKRRKGASRRRMLASACARTRPSCLAQVPNLRTVKRAPRPGHDELQVAMRVRAAVGGARGGGGVYAG